MWRWWQFKGLSYFCRSTDLLLDMVQVSVDTLSSNHSKLYPIQSDTFRVILISPKRQFSLRAFLCANDAYFLFGFFVYLLFSYIGRSLLFGDRNHTNLCELGLTIFYETTGQAVQQPHRHLSISVAKAFYSFFMFVYFVSKTGRIIALMTNSIAEAKVTSLSDIRDSNMDLVLTTAFEKANPEAKDLVRDRLREPIVMSTEQMLERVQNDHAIFGVIYSDHAVRGFLANHLQGRKYCVVSEAFGETVALPAVWE